MTARDAGWLSTKVACAAPRLSASMPTAPLPAHRSRKRLPCDRRPDDVEERLAQHRRARADGLPRHGVDGPAAKSPGGDAQAHDVMSPGRGALRSRAEGGGGAAPCGRQLRARPGLARPCARSVQLAPPGGAQTARFAPAGTLRCGRPGSLALRHASARRRTATAPVHVTKRQRPLLVNSEAAGVFTEGRWRGAAEKPGVAARGGPEGTQARCLSPQGELRDCEPRAATSGRRLQTHDRRESPAASRSR